jgi:hypothetical protein
MKVTRNERTGYTVVASETKRYLVLGERCYLTTETRRQINLPRVPKAVADAIDAFETEMVGYTRMAVRLRALSVLDGFKRFRSTVARAEHCRAYAEWANNQVRAHGGTI